MGDSFPPKPQILTNPRGGVYLLTWTTYGSWLPGSASGFIGRVRDENHTQRNLNRPGLPIPADMPHLQRWSRDRLSGSPTTLDIGLAKRLLASFGACAHRHDMKLGAVAIMTTHVHIVIRTLRTDGDQAMRLLKGSSSRDLGARAMGRWWTRGGSTRLLVDNASAHRALEYVRTQENPLLIWMAERKPRIPAG